MSLYDFKKAIEIGKEDHPFYALIMAAISKADTSNMQKLRMMFPEQYEEFDKRYNAPGGIIEGDE